MTKSYHGYRVHCPGQTGEDGAPMASTCAVQVVVGTHKRHLRPRLDIRSHSPTGFEWGYGGSGPAQLALALVADCCGDKMAHPRIYQRVKEKIVAKLPHDGWVLEEATLRLAIENAMAEAGIDEE
jgi:hypothetical protein